jgi:methyl-accepting chemotaxis protein
MLKSVVLLLTIGITLTLLFRINFQRTLTDTLTEELESIAHLGYDYVDHEYRGNWEIRDNALYKGDVLIGDGTIENGKYDAIDTIKEDTKAIITIFMYDENNPSDLGPFIRAATNVILDSGDRAVGTYVSIPVADVLVKGETFYGEANVVGVQYQTIYEPIFDENNQVVGSWFAGIKNEVIQDTINENTIRIGIAVLIIIVFAMVIEVLYSNVVVKRIRLISKSVLKLSEGDFTSQCKIDTTDEMSEICTAINEANYKLSNIIRDTQEVVESTKLASVDLMSSFEQVTESSEQIDVAVEDIAKGATEQAMEAEQGTKLMDKLSRSVDHIESINLELSEVAGLISEKNSEGVVKVQSLEEQSHLTYDKMENVSKVIDELNEQIHSITAITQTIDGIAAQTNLLALNASIEAARAGEAGRGFAVVADEIRKLAEETTASTETIESLIQSVQVNSENVVNNTNEVSTIVKKQSEETKDVSKLFDDINGSVNDMVDKISQSSEGVGVIAASKNDMLTSVTNIASVSEESAAATEEVSSSVTNQSEVIAHTSTTVARLNESIEILTDKLSKFKL